MEEELRGGTTLGPVHHALVLELAYEIGSSLDLGVVLERSLRAMRRLVDFRGGSIALRDDDALFIAAAEPAVSAEVAQLRLPIGHGLSGRVAETGKPIYSPDLDADDRVDPEVRRLGSNSGMVSYFAVPVIARGDVVGVLQLDSSTVDAFADEQRALLVALAPVIGSAIQNARAFADEKETRRRVDELDRRRADFISLATHELRTPLTTLLGFAELLGRRPLPDSVEEESLIDGINTSLARFARLIEEIQRLALLDAGGFELRIQKVELAPLILSAAAMTDRRVDILGPDRPVMVDTDPVWTREIFIEVIDNATKFSPEGTPIEVRIAVRSDFIEATVLDDGPGISVDETEVIFERFTQLSDPITRSEGGLGLGLAMAREVVQRLGGAIEAVPSGRGQVCVSIPASRKR